MGSLDGDKLRGHLEAMILATLERGDAHGLEILKRLEARGCGLLKLKEGSLYPALYRLEVSGEIEAAWEEPGHGRRGARRRIYRLTSKGGKRLKTERDEWKSFAELLSSILAPAAISGT